MFLPIFIAVICFSSEVLSHTLFNPCKLEDNQCIEKTVQELIPKLMPGIPSMGVEPSDPLFIEKIEGNLSILKYKFFNSTVTGLKKCDMKNFKVDKELASLHYELHCSSVKMVGKYEIDGRLIILPVQGKGDYSLITGKYILTIDAELMKGQGSDGKSHLSIKNFKVSCQPLSPIKYDFKNLFNGRKDLSDAVHNFAHQSWKEVAELVQEPTWYGGIKKMFSNINKFLKSVPLEEMFI